MRLVESMEVTAFRSSVAVSLRVRNIRHPSLCNAHHNGKRTPRRYRTPSACTREHPATASSPLEGVIAVPSDSSLSTQSNVSFTEAASDRARRAQLMYEWRGHEIRYTVAGPPDGAPILLVHGFGSSSGQWRRTVPALEATKELRVYAVDLLGFGASAKPAPSAVDGGYRLELWSQQITDFSERFGLGKQWALVGNSIGSLVCLLAAHEMGPTRVRSLALMNSAGGLVSFRNSELASWQRVVLRIFNAVLFNPLVGGWLFRSLRKRDNLRDVLRRVYVCQDAVDDELVDIIATPAFDPGAQEVFLAVFNADAGPAPEPLLEELHWCPILVCWGEQDALTPLYTGMHPGITFTKYHPRLALRSIADCGHCPFDDRPEEVNRFLIPFLLDPIIEQNGENDVTQP